MNRDIFQEAQGRWRAILAHFGVPVAHLDGKQHPCPVCEGKDRWRFDDGLDGKGGSFCNQCGSRNGWMLVAQMEGVAPAEAASRIRQVMPTCEVGKPKQEPSVDDRRREMQRIWLESSPVTPDDEAGRYLANRGLNLLPTLRFLSRCRYEDFVFYPAMIAFVHAGGDKAVTAHRTYLQGGQKAPVTPARKLLAGRTPPALAIRLMPAGEELGIAEGIETSLAAHQRFGVPVWATVSAQSMERFVPPAGVKRLRIFGDHDRSYTGQAAAYGLAKRLSAGKQPIEVSVELPPVIGTDWADAA